MYKTVLVPHGKTSAGDEALRHAIHVAKMESAKIVILNVVEPWPEHNFEEWEEDESTVQDKIEIIMSHVEDNARRFLAERVALCRKEGLSCEGIFRTGKPSDSIIKYANEQKVDLIVMAKKKKIPNYQSIFGIGNVTKKVQEKTTCPILLVDTEKMSKATANQHKVEKGD